MIIKSMSRASMSFGQLIGYLEKDDTLDRHTWNMYADKNNSEELAKEFMSNSEHIREARGRVYMYHEVVSLEKNSLSQERQREILFSLADEYVKQRADNHLVYGVVHSDTKNLHMHLVISSNRVYANKRTRLSKNRFASIQSNLQSYKNSTFKELQKTRHYKNQKDVSKSKQKEQEIQHQRHKQPIKEQIRESLQSIFDRATSKEYLQNAMKSKGYELYTRGKTLGVRYKDKNYRLKTLGIETSYHKALDRVDTVTSREEKRSEFKNSKAKTSTNRRDFSRSNSSNNSSRSR